MLIGEQLDRYQLLSTLGEGGMGVVYLAQDAATGDRVALKVLSGATGGPEAVLQFKQEFRTMTRLKHPNTVEVFDFGQLPDGTPYFSMEVVAGQGLDELIPLERSQFDELFVQLCRALAFIHAQGFVHGDLKPENVRVTPDGTLKLMDFGLMGAAGQSGGAIRGTLAYMAPEVAKRSRVDQRADLYALGALAYHLLIGRPPFSGPDPLSVIRAHLEDPIPPMDGVDPPLARVLGRLLAKDPTGRYSSCNQLLADLGIDLGESGGPVLLASPFVGREVELATLQDGFRKAQGAIASLAVAGDAGLGKSRLLDEFRFFVQLEGATYVGAACAEGDRLPYGPFVSALRTLLPTLRRFVPELVDKHAPVLAGLMPELAGAGPAQDAIMDPRQTHLLRQGAVCELLAAGAVAGQGLVLALDNWQWADETSRDLLAYLERNADRLRPDSPRAPLLVVRSGRSPEEGAILLSPLGPEAIGEMVAAMLGEPPEPAFLSAFGTLIGGNPLFIEASLAHLVEKQVLVRESGHWTTRGVVLTQAHLPQDLKALLWERFTALSPEALALARVASALAGSTSLSLLRRSASLPEEAALDALSELVDGGLMEVADGHCRFTQGQYGELLYGALDDEERVALHSAIARVLEADIRGAGEAAVPLAELPMESVGQLARHFLRSRFAEEAVAYALEAGRRNLDLLASHEAVTLLEAGFGRLSELGSDDRLDRLRYQRYLGDGYRITSRLDQAQAAYEAALAIAEELDQTAQKSPILTGLGIVHQIRSRYPQAVECLQRALSSARLRSGSDPAGKHAGDAADPVVEELRAMGSLYRVHHAKGDATRAIQLAEEAIGLSRQVGQSRFLSDGLSFLGLLYVSTSPERIPMGMEYLNEAIGLKQRIGDRRGLNDAYMLLGNAQLALGHLEDALASFQENQRICRELGIVDDEVCSYLNLGIADLELGHFDEAFSQAQVAHRMARDGGNTTFQGMGLALMALSAAYQGLLSRGRGQLDEALGLAEGNDYLAFFVRMIRMEYRLLMGDCLGALTEGGEAEAAQKRANIEEYPICSLTRLSLLRGQVHLVLGEFPAAREALGTAMEQAKRSQNQAILARVYLAAGHLALAYGDLAEATEHAGQALQWARANGTEGTLCEALILTARLVARTKPEAAQEVDVYLQEALHLAERQDCPHLLAQCLYTMARLGAQLGARNSVTAAALRQAQEIQANLVRSLASEDAEQFLAIDHRWRIQQGDLSPDETPSFQDGSPPTDPGEQKQYRELRANFQRLQVQLEELRASNQRLEQVVSFGLETNRLADLDELLDRILRLVVGIVGAERGFLLLPEREQLHCRSRFSRLPEGPTATNYSQSIADKVFATGNSLYLADALGEEGFSHQKSIMDLQIRTVVCVPLEIRGTRLGVLYVDRQSLPSLLERGTAAPTLAGGGIGAGAGGIGAFDDRDLTLVQALANQAAQVIENARLFTEGQTHAKHMEMLNAMARSVSTTLKLDEVLKLVIDNTLDLTRAERGFIFLQDDAGALLCKCAKDRDGHALVYTEGLVSNSIRERVMQTGKAELVVDTQDHEEFQAQRSILALNLRTVMAVPLTAKNRRLGVLYVDSQEVVNAFTEGDLDLLTAIASQASVAIENADLFEKATVDGLTKLYFRSYFEGRLSGEIKRSERLGSKVSLMMIDIDHFKKFNDSYGHQTGDEVLRLVAGIIRDGVRADLDVPCRYGGEEMLVLMPDTDTEGAQILAERLRERIELTELPGPNDEILHVRVSVGVATLPTMAKTGQTLIEAADQALYHSKRNGRNQVTIWRPGLEMDPQKAPTH